VCVFVGLSVCVCVCVCVLCYNQHGCKLLLLCSDLPSFSYMPRSDKIGIYDSLRPEIFMVNLNIYNKCVIGSEG
jgi:hypothetical protein